MMRFGRRRPSGDLETLTKLEYLTAWRTWGIRLSKGAPYLHSVATPTAWMPCEAMQARCRYLESNMCACDSCPGDDTACGIYAYKEEPDAVYGEGIYSGIIGQVALWGNVIEHVLGFRGEYAYPLNLTRSHCSWCISREPIPLKEMLAITPESHDDELVWACDTHVEEAQRRIEIMGTKARRWTLSPQVPPWFQKDPAERWVVKPGLEIANVIAELYQLTIET